MTAMTSPSWARVQGPLAVFAEGFAGELARLGYKPNAAADQLRLMAHLSRWVDAGQHEVAGLTPPVTEAFLAARRAEATCSGCRRRRCVPLLEYLRRLGVVPRAGAGPGDAGGGAAGPVPALPGYRARPGRDDARG